MSPEEAIAIASDRCVTAASLLAAAQLAVDADDRNIGHALAAGVVCGWADETSVGSADASGITVHERGESTAIRVRWTQIAAAIRPGLREPGVAERLAEVYERYVAAATATSVAARLEARAASAELAQLRRHVLDRAPRGRRVPAVAVPTATDTRKEPRMTRDDDAPLGSYVGRDDATGGRGLWWVPPGGAPWERLPPVHHRSVDGPNWGYEGNGPTDAAEAILLHVTGDPATAERHARAFAAEVLARQPIDRHLDLPATAIEDWTLERGIPLTPGWSPYGPQLVVRHWQGVDGVERYALALDGWDLLRIDLADNTPSAVVGVTDLKGRVEFRWTGTVAVAEAGDGHEAEQPGSRVSAERLPFGGWAVQVDGFDVAIIERDSGRATNARVAVYDRTPDSGLLVFDEFVRYRQVPTEPVAIGELLRRFSGTDGAARIRGR